MRRVEYIWLFCFLFIFLVFNSIIINTSYRYVISYFSPFSPLALPGTITNAIFSVILATLSFFTATVIILERRDPAKTLAWILIIIFLPILGFILYLVLGRKFRKRRLSAKKKALNEYIYPLCINIPARENILTEILGTKQRLINLILNNADFPLTFSNEVTVLTDGKEIFPAFFQAIEKARETIHLEMYILRNDTTGKQFCQRLITKAREGIKVRIIVDGIGSRELSRSYVEKMRAEGIEIHFFFPVRLPFLHSRVNYRNHRKILVIDSTTGFVGGSNIGDEYLGLDPQIGHWRETHLEITGPSVYFLQRIFLQDWFFVTGQALEGILPEEYSLSPDTDCHRLVQITASGPDTHWEAIMQVYYYAIATAQESVHLTSPYFVPNESILTALKTAALSGVDVKILLPAKPDHRIVFWAAMSYLEELIDAGVEVYLYQNGFLHSKVLTVDSMVSTVGSANMDQRSFNLNFEVNALIYDDQLTKRLEQDFYEDLAHSRKIDPVRFHARPMRYKAAESIARLLSPLL